MTLKLDHSLSLSLELFLTLIQYYQIEADGLCIELRCPCLSVKNFKLWASKETNEEQDIFDCWRICLIYYQGVGQFGEVWEGLYMEWYYCNCCENIENRYYITKSFT